MKNELGCNYMGYDFGASYIDSMCIGGQLFDGDACDGDGNLYEPMEYIACPACNHTEWLKDLRDEIEERGWVAAEEGKRRSDNPYHKAKLRFPGDRRPLRRWWNRGFRMWEKEQSAKGDR